MTCAGSLRSSSRQTPRSGDVTAAPAWGWQSPCSSLAPCAAASASPARWAKVRRSRHAWCCRRSTWARTMPARIRSAKACVCCWPSTVRWSAAPLGYALASAGVATTEVEFAKAVERARGGACRRQALRSPGHRRCGRSRPRRRPPCQGAAAESSGEGPRDRPRQCLGPGEPVGIPRRRLRCLPGAPRASRIADAAPRVRPTARGVARRRHRTCRARPAASGLDVRAPRPAGRGQRDQRAAGQARSRKVRMRVRRRRQRRGSRCRRRQGPARRNTRLRPHLDGYLHAPARRPGGCPRHQASSMRAAPPGRVRRRSSH